MCQCIAPFFACEDLVTVVSSGSYRGLSAPGMQLGCDFHAPAVTVLETNPHQHALGPHQAGNAWHHCSGGNKNLFMLLCEIANRLSEPRLHKNKIVSLPNVFIMMALFRVSCNEVLCIIGI